MSFFLSSPPQPTYQKAHHQSHQQHSFLTPQAHRTNFFSDPIAWPSFQFQPKSPSPLRPSWNAGNVMRRQPHDTKVTGDDCQNTASGEVTEWENSRNAAGSSLFAEYTGTTTTHTTTDPSQTSTNPPTTTNTLFTTQQQTSTNPPRNPFTFQSQSQSTRPTTQLSSRIRNNRDTRRSLFLDRLRSSRRDERDNNIIEKFEKEEYWAERRRREERMSREAEGWVGWDDEGVEYGVDGEEEDGQDGEGLSPVDEEREVGELVEGWFEVQQEQQRQAQPHLNPTGSETNKDEDDDFMDAQFDFEDSDVEEAFMQVLSQQGEKQHGSIMGGDCIRGGGGASQDKDAEMS